MLFDLLDTDGSGYLEVHWNSNEVIAPHTHARTHARTHGASFPFAYWFECTRAHSQKSAPGNFTKKIQTGPGVSECAGLTPSHLA